MVSPVIHMRRTATEDAEINGQRIAKDEKVVLWYGAANDPEVFANLDTPTCIVPTLKSIWLSVTACTNVWAPVLPK